MAVAPDMSKPERFLARGSGTGMLSRLFNRKPSPCFILGEGLRVETPLCCICGKDLDLPDRSGEAFMLAAPMANSRAPAPSNGAATWLFFGTKVLVAAVSARLAPLLEASVAFFGEKVLVVMAKIRGGSREPIVFCRGCGVNVLEKVNPPSRKYYLWDWLADLKPRRKPALAKFRRHLPAPSGRAPQTWP
jgi:hypothetical protein